MQKASFEGHFQTHFAIHDESRKDIVMQKTQNTRLSNATAIVIENLEGRRHLDATVIQFHQSSYTYKIDGREITVRTLDVRGSSNNDKITAETTNLRLNAFGHLTVDLKVTAQGTTGPAVTRLFRDVNQAGIHGNGGNDTLAAKGRGLSEDDGFSIYMSGGSGNDTMWTPNGFDGQITMDGGNGSDKIDFSGAFSGTVFIGMNHRRVAFAGSGKDTLIGSASDDHLYGEDGNDKITAKAGNDRLDGGFGNDTLYGESGDDSITGGYGYRRTSDPAGPIDTDLVYAGGGDDYIEVLPLEGIELNADEGWISGIGSRMKIFGEAGDDSVFVMKNSDFPGTQTLDYTLTGVEDVRVYDFASNTRIEPALHNADSIADQVLV